MTTAYLSGFLLGLSLIAAIGAQNAFVLRQGLRGEHVLAVCLACALSDACLIVIGVAGFDALARILPGLDGVMRYGGAAFLLVYAGRRLVAAMRSQASLKADRVEQSPLMATLATCLAFTWLNPHVYLDTVALLGSVSTRYAGNHPAFAAGAITASFLFFFALGYGAAWLRPIFANPIAWRILDLLIALTMAAIAMHLVI
jgi:L-lysine exporter family protein LysE/ArgO